MQHRTNLTADIQSSKLALCGVTEAQTVRRSASQIDAIVNRPPSIKKPRCPRLNSRQVTFFRHVFGAGLPVGDVLQDLNIRLSTFNRWLQSPRFLKELEMNFTRFYMTARIEVARSIGPAVCGLSNVNQKTMDPEAVRKAGNDLIKLQHIYSALPGASGMRLRIGSKSHRFGLLLEQFGLKITQESHDLAQPCLSNPPEKTLKSPQNCSLPDVQEIEITQMNPTFDVLDSQKQR